MKFVKQNIELINKDDSGCKFRINTSFAVYKEIIKRFGFIEINKKEYITKLKQDNISLYDLNTDDGIINAYKDGYSITSIFPFTKYKSIATIYNKVRKYGLTGRNFNHKFNINDSYFNNIDSPEKAYLLGIIQTDGTINKDRLNITQKKEYSWYLYSMLSNITSYVNMLNNGSCYKVDISSRNITDNLKMKGIMENKTYVQSDDDIDKLFSFIPDEYMGDFIRGLIDGDGWISFFIQSRGINESAELGFCARNERIIDRLNSIISEKINYYPSKYKSHDVWYTRIRDINKIKKFGKYLFKNFKYPYGHPKKSTSYINRLEDIYEFSEYGDPMFEITMPISFKDFNPIDKFLFYDNIAKEEYEYKRQNDKSQLYSDMNISFNIYVHNGIDFSLLSDIKLKNNIHIDQYNKLIENIKYYF